MIHWLVSNTQWVLCVALWHESANQGSVLRHLTNEGRDMWWCDNKCVYDPGDDADWDNNDMITERDINICDNDRTRDGVRAGLMNTFNKDNDLAPSSLLPTQRKLMQMLQLILTNVCQPGWRDDYCVVFLLWTLFWTCLNNIWGGIRVGVMMKGTNVCPVSESWSSDLHTLSICYHRDSAHINIFIFTLTRHGLQLTPTSGHTNCHSVTMEKSRWYVSIDRSY